jgi:LEA14-like dessication related protein
MDRTRRQAARRITAVALAAALGGCAALTGHDTLRVHVVSFEQLPAEGMEVRLAVKLRLQNAGELPVDYDGVAIELELGGTTFASGVSSQRGTVARFSEALVTVPVSVSALAVLRQALALARGRNTTVTYALRGRLAGPGVAGMRFGSTGEIDLVRDLGGL